VRWKKKRKSTFGWQRCYSDALKDNFGYQYNNSSRGRLSFVMPANRASPSMKAEQFPGRKVMSRKVENTSATAGPCRRSWHRWRKAIDHRCCCSLTNAYYPGTSLSTILIHPQKMVSFSKLKNLTNLAVMWRTQESDKNRVKIRHVYDDTL
jgi:hypothetical protein